MYLFCHSVTCKFCRIVPNYCPWLKSITICRNRCALHTNASEAEKSSRAPITHESANFLWNLLVLISRLLDKFLCSYNQRPALGNYQDLSQRVRSNDLGGESASGVLPLAHKLNCKWPPQIYGNHQETLLSASVSMSFMAPSDLIKFNSCCSKVHVGCVCI